ncbi:SpoIIE family protein phosphatase [candidate division FCPU426 bacterium]|nr:SpoIIE family protein phosphatase [candidate division FCPU426 bacterium]
MPANGATPIVQPNTENPPKSKRSLRYKFGLSVTLLLTLTIIFISFFALQGEERALRTELEQRGITIAKNMAVNAAKPLLRGEILPLASLVKDAMGNKGVMYALLVDENGMIVAHNKISESGKTYERPLGVLPLERRMMSISRPFMFEKIKTVDIAIPVLLQNQAKLGEVHIGLSQRLIEEVIRNAVMQIVFIALGFIFTGIVVTLILVSIIVQPIRALEAGAHIIGQGNLDYTINVKSQDEIGNLARTFNKMTGDLKNAQKSLIEKEKMEQELETARKIQAVLLPKEDPHIEGLQIVSFYKSAKEVGGDYYDFHQVKDNILGLTVADVSGKGIPGCLGMVMTRSILRSQIYLADAYTVISKTNALLYKDIKRGMFVTMFFALIDIKKKILNCANAGHNPMIVGHPDGKVEMFNPEGIALGLDKGDRFDKKTQAMNIPLKAGDVFALYTDGVTEAMNTKEEEFTEERLAEVVGRNVGLNAQQLNDTIINELMDFTSGAPQHDDITLITVKVE